MKRKYVSVAAFDAMCDNNEGDADVVYVIKKKNGERVYAVSPDGEGFIFYESNEQVKENY